MADRSFIFYENFWNSVKNLDDKSRLEALDAIIVYGLTGELPEEIDSLGYALAQSFSTTLNKSRRWKEEQIDRAMLGGRKANMDDEIKALLQENPNLKSSEIAEMLGNRISAAAIRQKQVWKDRFKDSGQSAIEQPLPHSDFQF